VGQRRRREIDAGVALALGGQAEQQQAGATADLQDAPGAEGADAAHGVVDPLAHLLGGDGLAGVAAVPARGVEGGVGGGAGLAALVGVVPDLLPLGGGVAALGGALVGDQIG